MNEIIYSINGKFLKDFQITVSKSDGVFDILKRKPIKTYDWSEYNGNSPDLSSPKFEPREIKLDCFVVGEDFDDMMNNFNSIFRDEFMKSGVQELIIRPFAYKERIYHVYLDSEIQLKKTFKKGKIAATFSVKLIEPNPIKKVLKLIGNSLNISYNSPNETEIFYGNGLKEIAKGNVSLSNKTLANRVVSGYAFEGRNLFLNSKEARSYVNTFPFAVLSNLALNTRYALSFKAKIISGNAVFHTELNGGIGAKDFTITDDWDKYECILTSDNNSGLLYFWLVNGIGEISLKEIKLEKGIKVTDWTPAPEDEKYIIIAGNINEITNLTTNAQVLWELL